MANSPKTEAAKPEKATTDETVSQPRRYLWASVAGLALIAAGAVYVATNVVDFGPQSTAQIDFTTPGGEIRSVVARTELGRKTSPAIIDEAVEGAEEGSRPAEVAVVGNSISVADPVAPAESLESLTQVIQQLSALESRIVALDEQLVTAQSQRQAAPDVTALHQQMAIMQLHVALSEGGDVSSALAAAKQAFTEVEPVSLLAQLEVLTAEGVVTPLSLYRSATTAQKWRAPRMDITPEAEEGLSFWARMRIKLSRWIDVRPVAEGAETWGAELEKAVAALAASDAAAAAAILDTAPLADDARLDALRQNTRKYQTQRQLLHQLRLATQGSTEAAL